MNFLDEERKFVSVLDAVATDAEKGLVYASQYAIPAGNLATLFFPGIGPGVTAVETALNLMQHSVLEVKAKAAALPAGLPPDVALADQLHLAAPAAIALLQTANIKVDTSRVGSIMKVMESLFSAREAPAPLAAATPAPASV